MESDTKVPLSIRCPLCSHALNQTPIFPRAGMSPDLRLFEHTKAKQEQHHCRYTVWGMVHRKRAR